MILNGSDQIGSLNMRDVTKQLSGLDLDDEYREEFAELIRHL